MVFIILDLRYNFAYYLNVVIYMSNSVYFVGAFNENIIGDTQA